MPNNSVTIMFFGHGTIDCQFRRIPFNNYRIIFPVKAREIWYTSYPGEEEYAQWSDAEKAVCQELLKLKNWPMGHNVIVKKFISSKSSEEILDIVAQIEAHDNTQVGSLEHKLDPFANMIGADLSDPDTRQQIIKAVLDNHQAGNPS